MHYVAQETLRELGEFPNNRHKDAGNRNFWGMDGGLKQAVAAAAQCPSAHAKGRCEMHEGGVWPVRQESNL